MLDASLLDFTFFLCLRVFTLILEWKTNILKLSKWVCFNIGFNDFLRFENIQLMLEINTNVFKIPHILDCIFTEFNKDSLVFLTDETFNFTFPPKRSLFQSFWGVIWRLFAIIEVNWNFPKFLFLEFWNMLNDYTYVLS